MPQEFEIVFEKLQLALQEPDSPGVVEAGTTTTELDEIEELRRFSAELQEPEPLSFTSS